MTRWFIFLLIFLASTSDAQESLLHPHYFLDTCPDPLTNHIASRKYFKIETDTNDRWTINDTVIEYYDIEGKLTSAICQNARYTQDRGFKSWCNFTYDQKGRIVCDSFSESGKLAVTTYEYHGNQAIIHNPPSKWSDILPTVYINYDDNYNRISQYRVNEYGDTVNFWEVNGNTTTDRWMSREDDGTYTISSTTSEVIAPRQKWEFVTIYHQEEDDTSHTAYLYSYNSTGQLIENIYVGEEERRDTSYYYYTNNRLTFYERKVWVREDWKFVQWETYQYNDRGQLIEKREFGDGSENYPTVTSYRYNERGLIAAIDVWHQYPDDRPNYYVRKERFEYTYYAQTDSEKKQ